MTTATSETPPDAFRW